MNQEGTLWKWTNYLSGWQPRWFVLENGILSYYKAQDDVNNGCKGSVKLSVCDVIVHNTDRSRLDLIIPGEAHFYLKAATPQERQLWLVALGTCKACLTQDGRTIKKPEGLGTSDDLRAKKSELRLYCDVLMQQVLGIKLAIANREQPDIEKLDEASSLMKATCDHFVATLDDCMRLASNHVCYTSTPTHVTDSALAPSSPTRSSASKKPFTRSSSTERHIPPPNLRESSVQIVPRSRISASEGSETGSELDTPKLTHHKAHRTHHGHHDTPDDPMSQYDIPEKTPHKSDHGGGGHRRAPSKDQDEFYDLDDDQDDEIGQGEDIATADNIVTHKPHSNGVTNWRTTERVYPTFFTNMKVCFSEIPVRPGGGIPVLTFLEACHAVLPIFDKLSATAFAPVKMDIAGNIKKIRQKFTSDPGKFETLQDIVQYEIKNNQQENSNSATVALLWLKRAVEFIAEFLHEVIRGDEDLASGASNAYSKTLRPFHGWVVRGVFALALKSVPYRKDFLQHLASVDYDISNMDFMPQILRDIQAYIDGIHQITKILRTFYCDHNLDCPDQV
ncbi:unnamed protein product [Owenia fusiformis]|uniref:Pleckstrin homology domain-containing family A member 8 n=1 Tax=Owenia fusiformis TaxID=6347 RepID=A0A8J1TU61_OWEFU|nr:unnamed protein product [Owenia fusiformis]